MPLTNPVESNYKQYLPPDAYSDADASSVAAQARKVLAEVYSDHVASIKRNTADTAIDNQAISGDQDSIKVATSTGALADQLKSYTAAGGDFSDQQGQQLGEQFIAALRKQRDDNTSDHDTDVQYAGIHGMEKHKRHKALHHSGSIANAASELTDASITPDRREQLLQGILTSATAIGDATADPTHQAGKDQSDANKEATVIAHDARALLAAGASLTPDQQGKLISDIGSKALLIGKELNDIPNETKYAAHDTAAIQAGADMEAILSYAMKNHNAKSIGQLDTALAQYHSADGKGVLDVIAQDRQQDLQLEPQYIKANTADNAKNNQAIIEFTNPFISRAS